MKRNHNPFPAGSRFFETRALLPGWGPTGLGLLAALTHAVAQYAPPPPPEPFQGFLNEALRKDYPYMNQWDFGGALRVRYEVKEGFAIQGVTGSLDFRDHGADVDNEYLLERIRYHVGYTENWWSAYAEGRSSLAQSDERFAYFANPLPPNTATAKGTDPNPTRLICTRLFSR